MFGMIVVLTCHTALPASPAGGPAASSNGHPAEPAKRWLTCSSLGEDSTVKQASTQVH